MQDPVEMVQKRVSLEAVPLKEGSELSGFDLGRVPRDPGCYIMQDKREKVIYVGKAKDLRARLRSYLNASDTRYSVKFLMRRVQTIDFLVTTNEKEALLLENSLIKQYKPRYNVQLKDDKNYISLRLDPKGVYPRITVVRKHKRDGARYFGPYHSSKAVRLTLKQIQRIFPLRTCSDHVLHNRNRPCLYYQMKQCCAPCVDLVTKENYEALVQQVIYVLDGRTQELEQVMLQQIDAHATALEFEQAAVLRDRLFALRSMMERQRTVEVAGSLDRDVFGIFGEGRFTAIQILFYRGGKMLGGRSYFYERTEVPREELLSSFLLQYYSTAPVVPGEVLIPFALEEVDIMGEVLAEQREARVQVLCPQRGEKLALVDLANRNAERSFQEKRLKEKANVDVLEQMQQALQLPRLPHRIECFDISTMQGDKTVASMVVFEGGEAAKKRYRKYSMKTVDGQDDFASMREVLMRRYTRAIAEDDLPDFVLIDGGKGQLNVASAVFKDLGIEDLPRAGIAKARTKEEGRTAERFFVPGRMNPILLKQNGAVVKLMAQIRDEAHRFAITYHRKLRNKSTLSTTLTDIPGVGPKRARALLKTLGSIARIKESDVAAITGVPGFNEQLARAVVSHLQGG